MSAVVCDKCKALHTLSATDWSMFMCGCGNVISIGYKFVNSKVFENVETVISPKQDKTCICVGGKPKDCYADKHWWETQDR